MAKVFEMDRCARQTIKFDSCSDTIEIGELNENCKPPFDWVDCEQSIIWKYPPQNFSYLRESFFWTTKPTGAIYGWSRSRGIWVETREQLQAVADKGINDARRLIVAYAEVVSNHSKVYARRYWWLKSYDYDICPDGVYAKGHPCEAVIPSSIAINHWSKRGAADSSLVMLEIGS